MAQLDEYLKHMMNSRASDLHISAGEPARMRVDGDLVVIDPTPLNNEQAQGLLFEILDEEEFARFEKNKNLDRSYAVQGLGNFRFNLFLTRRGVAAVIRAIPSKIPTMRDLGLPETVQRLAESDKGLILVTGPTGSGKSTTLASMINHINYHFPYHVLTVEDPIEFVHESKQSLINQREIGPSCHTFADALKYALREDPDVILVGELRDLETMALAMTAAETGHLVFATLHTRGAAASIDRLIDSFPANQQAMIRTMLSESLIAVISQALIKRASGQGRIAAYEIMVTNHAISNLIREGKTFQIQTAMQTGRRDGMILMEQHIRELLANGTAHPGEAEALLNMLGANAAPKTKMQGTPAVPVRTATAKPEGSGPKPFKPSPLEVTYYGKKPDAEAAPAAPPTPAPVAAAKPVAQPFPRPAAAAPATPVGAAPRPKPPPMAKPAAGAAGIARPGVKPAAAVGAFAPLKETDTREVARTKPTPPARPKAAGPARAVPAPKAPEPTVLTDLTADDGGAGELMDISESPPEDAGEAPETTPSGSDSMSDLDLFSLSLPEEDGGDSGGAGDSDETEMPVAPPRKKIG